MKKGFDIVSFAEDYRVEFHTSGFKQCRPGWAQFVCPYCNSHKPFLGFNMEKAFFNCYHCGFHPLGETLMLLANIPAGRLRLVYKQYAREGLTYSPIEREYIEKKSLPIPNWWQDLSNKQLDYLYDRGFDDPEGLAILWGLYGSNYLAPRGYTHRIIIPYYNNEGGLLCYTSRSISEHVDNKYKANKPGDGWDVKECLYGLWNVPGDSVVVVEGQADAWKLGMGAVATGGTAYTQTQVKLLSSFAERYILFDNEDSAQDQASKLADELSCFEGNTYVIGMPRSIEDPGEFTEEEGRQVMKDLIYGGML